MSIARKLERRLEQLIEGASSAIFRGKVDAIELANRLVREADLSTVEGPAGDVAPNVYHIAMHPSDLGDPEATNRVVTELMHVIESTAMERGWRLEGPATVTLAPDPSATQGSLHISTSVAAGARPVWGTLSGVSGISHDLTLNRLLIGRDESADVRLGEWEASRRHAILWREAGRVWLADLGSTNGTFIGSDRVVGTRALESNNLLTFGAESFTYRQL
ncbi:MAG: DUF3662 domain-containing protein [Acidimicrobiia bacterium]|nr:FHA domain-containing protein [Acidimicrobiia bacterium]NNF64332.1 DUF3662 domain-containing protein [Acidimicrobiia bacterium]